MQVLAWTKLHDSELFDALTADSDYTNSVLAIERSGDKPRKDIAKWSDIPEQFGYFYDVIFERDFKNKIAVELNGRGNNDIKDACRIFLENYDHSSDKDAWFENMKIAATMAGFCLDRKELKENPGKYKGGIADYATIIRVVLTGKSRTPDLWTIMQIMGKIA